MEDQDRRLEVLKAEEAVRQLAEELARASQSRLAAEEVAEKLGDAHATLEQARQVLTIAFQAMRNASEDAQSALAEARTHLGTVEGQVAQAADELRGAAQQLAGFTPAVSKRVAEAEEVLSAALRRLGRRVSVCLVLSALAFSGALACLLLLLLLPKG